VLDALTIRDTLTKLVWQRQASGTTMIWAAAETYCSSAGSGFRLPTARELASLLDLTVTSGAKIDQTAFPNTPQESFWTSSSYPSPGQKRTIDFGDGSSDWSDGATSSLRVRCVH
jgi:hypothetical protein